MLRRWTDIYIGADQRHMHEPHGCAYGMLQLQLYMYVSIGLLLVLVWHVSYVHVHANMLRDDTRVESSTYRWHRRMRLFGCSRCDAYGVSVRPATLFQLSMHATWHHVRVRKRVL